MLTSLKKFGLGRYCGDHLVQHYTQAGSGGTGLGLAADKISPRMDILYLLGAPVLVLHSQDEHFLLTSS